MATNPRHVQRAHFHVEVIRDTHPSPQGFQALALAPNHPEAAYVASMPCPIFIANETVTSIRAQLADTTAPELDRLAYAASLYYKHGLVVKILGKDERDGPERPDGILLVILRPEQSLTHGELVRRLGQQTFNSLPVGGFSQAIQRAEAETQGIRDWDAFATERARGRQGGRSSGRPRPPPSLPAPTNVRGGIHGPGGFLGTQQTSGGLQGGRPINVTLSGYPVTTERAGGTMPIAPTEQAPTYGDIRNFPVQRYGADPSGVAPTVQSPYGGGAVTDPSSTSLRPGAPSFTPGRAVPSHQRTGSESSTITVTPSGQQAERGALGSRGSRGSRGDTSGGRGGSGGGGSRGS